ncbi:hypothetical protein GCM10020331_039340 [Ectobacillus funiculus]
MYITTGSELAIGKFGLVSSAISFLCYYLATRLIKDAYRKKGNSSWGAFFLYVGVYLVIIDVTYPKLLIYAACIAVAYPILLVPYISMTYDVIGKARQAKELRVEYIVVRELFLNAGRICSIVSFFDCCSLFFSRSKACLFYLAFLGMGHLLVYFCSSQCSVRDNSAA